MKKRQPDEADLLASTVEIDARTATPYVINNNGPNAFHVRMTPERVLVCDPDVPLEHGCLVVVEIEASAGTSYSPGTLETKHPAESGLSWQGPREEVFRVTWEHLKRPFDKRGDPSA
jgi:hypothetical protein